jgi:hypothetical protein
MIEFCMTEGNLTVKYLDEYWAVGYICHDYIQLFRYPRAAPLYFPRAPTTGSINYVGQLGTQNQHYIFRMKDVQACLRQREFAFSDPTTKRFTRQQYHFMVVHCRLKTVKDIQEDKDKASRKPREAA